MKIKRISSKSMKGKQTQKEKGASRFLRKWHKNAEKKKDFGGVLEKEG